MAGQPDLDVAQAHRTAQLAVQHRNELAPGGQPANPVIGAVLAHEAIKRAPRNLLQNRMENAIVVLHGIDP
ncbi:hypothetical protein D3C87_1373500 [compost metagenome]